MSVGKKIMFSSQIACALYVGYDKAPYFPIEISRVLASDIQARILFICACFFYFVTLSPKWYSIELAVASTGVFFVGAIDDVTSWWGHLFGVALIGVAVLIVAFRSKKSFLITCALGAIFALRLALKAYAVQGDIALAHEIMFKGTKDAHVLAIFKLCGVLQWIVFAGILFFLF